MKWFKLYVYSMIVCAFCVENSAAQDKKSYEIMLRSGVFTPEKNIAKGKSDNALRTNAAAGKSFVIIQFEEIPTAAERAQMKAEGIELLEYIPNFAYTATITSGSSRNALARLKGRSIFTLEPEQKMEAALANGRIPARSIKNEGLVDVWVNFVKSFSYEEVSKGLKENGFTISSDQFKDYQVLEVRLPITKLRALAGLQYIQYVQSLPQEDKPFNDKSIGNSRANILRATMPGGRGLTGKGVVVGVGDESNPQQHLDFSGRLINSSAAEAGTHGVHVIGTVAGGGIMNERYEGYAPKATIVAQTYSKIISFAPQYVKDYGMVITNNSYGGDINNCETFGVYDLYSYILDQQAFQMPYLQHVFAAGNSGTSNCSPLLAGFGNVLSGYQTAKNVISVGNVNDIGTIYSTSSRGPVRDGRVKPEIMAQGNLITSTIPVNLYGGGTGTSMSSPAVAGGLALLTERFRQLNENKNPKNALLKALVINGSMDKGNDGPDYRYGFGNMNLLRSVKMLESGSYVNDSLSHNETKQFSINVPANTAQLKVMLYWNDPAATVLSEKNLVHNLDLQVQKDGGNALLPRILNSNPSSLNNIATTGVDNTNNIEQVSVNNPGAGNYTVTIKGTSIGQLPLQEYIVVYDVIPNSLALTFPVGGEKLRDGDAIQVNWDAFGNTNSTYTVQFSKDNGQSWTVIGNNLTAATRQLAWTIPAANTTDQARIKVVQNGTGVESLSEPFVIVGVPTLTLSSLQCEGYIALEWTAVTDATDYEVMILKGSEMVSAGITADRKFVLSGLKKDSTHVLSVRARIKGQPGRRAVAISRRPDTGTCAGTISDKDLKIDAIITPAASGRQHAGSQLDEEVFVKIRLKNLDDADFNGPIEVGYSLNGNHIPLETITPYIEKGKTYEHTFEFGSNMSAPGEYELTVYINVAGDPVTANNTLTKSFRQLANDPLVLPFLDDMEYLPAQSVTTAQVGLKGDGRYDFSSTSDAGRVRTFFNSGFAASGERALTLDASRYFSGGNTNYLIGTFNLSEYDVEDSDVRLNFKYKNHGQKTHANNRVWIRGKDTDPWIEAYDLFANQNLAQDGYKSSPGIEVSKLLAAAGKNLSSSFQVRFGQWGRSVAADYVSGAGYTFDDIQIYTVTDDIQVIALTQPAAESCGLGAQQPITVKIRNSSAKALENIPVSFELQDGTIVNDVIPALDKRTTIDFTFTQTADLSALGKHSVRVWSGLESDSYRNNDTVSLAFFNAPLISTFPYLENFEENDGYWSAKGVNSSWGWGVPASALVNTASSGKRIWKTNLLGSHNDKEESYLYSPCFQVAGMNAPMLSFSVLLDFEVCEPTPCDFVYLEYSGDGGAWTRLGVTGQGTNWYNKNYSSKGAWSVESYFRWHVATMALPTGFSDLKLRFVMISDGYTRREGISLDDIHIYDRQYGIHDGTTTASAISQQVSGDSWSHFTQNGRVVASIHPGNQNLGNTSVQTYINAGAVRNSNLQYYLDRSFTIKPDNASLSDSATIRLYFLESESEALIAASGCPGCSKPSNAFELTISKYRNNDRSKEDGLIGNSIDGNWSHHKVPQMKIVPYDKGYYAEMKLKNFSEFWLAKDFVGNSSSLPVDLISFDASKKTNAEGRQFVQLNWETASEENFDRFEIELAEGNEAYRTGAFQKIGEVSGAGGLVMARKYAFRDEDPGKTGVRYYRLKMVDADSTVAYSRIRPVVFDEKIEWAIYPNPSSGLFTVMYQADAGKEVSMSLYDLTGRVFRKSKVAATGFLQKEKIDLSEVSYNQGLYFLEVINGEEKQVFKLLKE